VFGKKWVSARGTIIAKQIVKSDSQGRAISSDFVVDVQPPDGELFRAKVSSPRILLDFRSPTPGAVVGVEYDPKSRAVRFDKDDPALRMKALKKSLHSSLSSSFDSALAQPAGSTPTAGTPSAETLAQLQALLGPNAKLPPPADPPSSSAR
jgi:hypothetical protein